MNKHKHKWYFYDWGYDERDVCFFQFRCRKCEKDKFVKCEDIKKTLGDKKQPPSKGVGRFV